MKFPAIIYKEARILESVLRRHGIAATVEGVNTRDEKTRYFLRLDDPDRIEQVRALADVLARETGRPGCTVRPFNELVILTMMPRPRPLFLADVWPAVQELPAGTALVGTNRNDQPVRLRLDSPDVSPMLISGGQRAGKSALARVLGLTLAVSSSPRLWRIALIPGLHQQPLATLAALPHVWQADRATAGTPYHLISVVESLVEAPFRESQTRVVVVVDDVEDVLVATGRAGRSALTWLLSDGLDRGVMPIVVSRRVHKLEDSLRSAFVLHAAGRPAADAPVPLVLQSVEGDAYPRMPGEFLLCGPTTDISLRAAWAGETSVREVINWYRHRNPIVFVSREVPDTEDDADTDEAGSHNGDATNHISNAETTEYDLTVPRLEFDDDMLSTS